MVKSSKSRRRRSKSQISRDAVSTITSGNILYAYQYLRSYMVSDEMRQQRGQECGLSSNAAQTASVSENRIPTADDAWTDPSLNKAKRRSNSLATKIAEIGAPFAGYCIIFDTETTPSDGQRLRFGYFQVRGIHADRRKRLAKGGQLTRDVLDQVHEHGFFYDKSLPADEIEILKQSVQTLERYRRVGNTPALYEWLRQLKAAPELKLLTREEFARQIIARYAKMEDALFIGHNLAFDLGALAREFGEAKDNYYGGFWLKYCNCDHKGDCGFHPPILIKKIGKQQHFIGWRSSVNPTTKKKDAARDVTIGKANFLDTATLAGALLKPKSTKLSYLCELLKTQTRKETDQEHGAPLTLEYVNYNAKDVQATWEVYCALRAEYRKHNLSKEIWRIYSSASLGAAYFEAMGVPRFLEQHEEFPPQYIGCSMSAYYGGRSEVHIGKEPREVMLVDFKSQYPTVNALMGLQKLLMAERIEIKQNPEHLAEIRAFVDGASVGDLQHPEFWQRLRCYVRVLPAADILPYRTQYEDKANTNIGLNSVNGSESVWYALADVIASRLLTGKMPEIIDAFELVPQGQVATKSIKFFGDDRFVIDLTRDDFFVRIIEMRIEIEKLAKACKDDAERDRLNAMAEALKFIANATSYGKLVEINIEEREERRAATVYAGEGNAKRVWVHKIEKPGKYFAGPIGALIPAAGRLLLAMAEKLAVDRGMSHVFCDTDSMCFTRPHGMPRWEFHAHIEAIVDWFTPLSPYRDQSDTPIPILKIEDVNYREGKQELGYEPLYCYAVSPKRYVLYHKLSYEAAVQAEFVQPIDEAARFAHGKQESGDKQSLIVIRKFSAHGTGDISQPDNYQPTPPIVIKPEKLGKSPYAAHLLHDLWRTHIEAVEAGREPEHNLSKSCRTPLQAGHHIFQTYASTLW